MLELEKKRRHFASLPVGLHIKAKSSKNKSRPGDIGVHSHSATFDIGKCLCTKNNVFKDAHEKQVEKGETSRKGI